ncbi:hypothetical protein LOZ58_003282 [Ophidiomyces ophidiicola]|nr:hypothetical protein LOZ58_003282 [Ophidiomyces ophidiicola]
MWILSSDGDFLQGKRVWLKPGKRYLFGRVSPNGAGHVIKSTTISRHHLVIEVGRVQQGDGAHIHAKSKLIVADQDTKCGSVVDGENIKGKTKELSARDEYSIFLGRYPHALKIKWCPVVLTFSFSELDEISEDPLANAQSRLEDLDIKTVSAYVVGKTTHVVQKGRDTTKGLQAIINGKYIVDPSYIELLLYAATSAELEAEESLSPLELDFDAAWPDPATRLPPQGSEKTKLPDSAYEPRQDRLNVFEGYTFVLFDETTFEGLQDPISNGHGKALLCEFESGKTKAQDIVDYVAKASSNKAFSHNMDGNGGVLLVQPQRRSNLKWIQNFETEVSGLIGQQFVNRDDFLDAVLRSDASGLYKPYQLAPAPPADQSRDPPMSTTSAASINATPRADSQMLSRPAKRPRTQTYVPKFKDFDDGFDMESIPAHIPDQDETLEGLSQDTCPHGDQTSHEIVYEDDGVSELLPGASAMKQHFNSRNRRKTPLPTEPQRRAKKPKIDIIEAARQHREAEDRAAMARREEEEAANIVDGMDLSKIQHLAIIEDMEIRKSSTDMLSLDGNSGRWDEKWNGRKNFKRFRRKGEGGVQHRVQPIIVPLEEARRKDFGIGDDYWNFNDTRSERTKSVTQESSGTMLASQPASQAANPLTISRPSKRTHLADSDDEDGLTFRFRRKTRR